MTKESSRGAARRVPDSVIRRLLDDWDTVAVVSSCIVISAMVFSQSIAQYRGSRGDLGTGTFPTWIAVCIALLAVALAIDASRNPRSAGATRERPRRRENLIAVGALVAYLLLLPILGLGFATVFFLAIQFHFVGGYSPVRAIIFATLIGFPIGYLFVRVLPIGLPAGLFGF